ncbi:hypothetical protein Atc_1043 [Acidithiobacillus caldus SM-1]|uniref:Uncharacterized protein n=1 Tax=Acidithiobacillus caldus (strain SM-1) TaxID=990288 RepID=F9ZLA6_ACICS|nr:hypothetical protein Atc_1043 [Acidithiobacillus caldus SM-1]QER45385.1 hypothetical protein F0726_02328 [Acidithiobacillus caldus]
MHFSEKILGGLRDYLPTGWIPMGSPVGFHKNPPGICDCCS